ncbi:tagaturonate reductase [Paenibacillus solisilvae]|uniref:Tagaturonate reductase n=1 Tax=Paenibacillus solisilvae TaxID=2486751 RepID=A0ABW0W2E3_9BACL
MLSGLKLNGTILDEEAKQQLKKLQGDPIRILQIGEGNFIRGFFDWMISECRKQGLFDGSIAVTQPRPSGKTKIEELREQDGLFSLIIRGLVKGEPVENKEIINVFGKVIDPYTEWDAFLSLAENESLQFVVSNTTEAGLVYREESYVEGQPLLSFPGKITMLLYRRYLAFNGASDRGLIFLPCELIERNGDVLRDCVLRYAGDWELPDEFKSWVMSHNRFLNSLVDRIVTGHPGEVQAGAWFEEWGYGDKLVSTAEPYHLWAIEGEPELDNLLPLRKAGLNVHWVEDLKPYQLRKVRILNGAHTLMTTIGILSDLEHVRELMEHDELGTFIRDAIEEEIIPALPLPLDEMKIYADSVIERYLNPYIVHRLSDIAMNSISKFRVRLLPSMIHYRDQGIPIPSRLTRGLAGLLRYYKVKQNEQGEGYYGTTFRGSSYMVRDEIVLLKLFETVWSEKEAKGIGMLETVKRLLANVDLWGQDLSQWDGLAEAVSIQLTELETRESL